MRAIFGLAGLLIVVGVIVYWMGAPGGELQHTQETLKAGDKARGEISQIAGRDTATGGRAMDSAQFEVLSSNGKTASLLVNSIVAGGAYEKYFGLQKGDVITAVEYQGFKKMVREMDDLEDGRQQVAEAYQRHGTLTIKRSGTEMTLPAAPAAPAPGTPAPAAQPRNSVQNQLEKIQNMNR